MPYDSHPYWDKKYNKGEPPHPQSNTLSPDFTPEDIIAHGYSQSRHHCIFIRFGYLAPI